jgi:hypothetical protein
MQLDCVLCSYFTPSFALRTKHKHFWFQAPKKLPQTIAVHVYQSTTVRARSTPKTKSLSSSSCRPGHRKQQHPIGTVKQRHERRRRSAVPRLPADQPSAAVHPECGYLKTGRSGLTTRSNIVSALDAYQRDSGACKRRLPNPATPSPPAAQASFVRFRRCGSKTLAGLGRSGPMRGGRDKQGKRSRIPGTLIQLPPRCTLPRPIKYPSTAKLDRPIQIWHIT